MILTVFLLSIGLTTGLIKVLYKYEALNYWDAYKPKVLGETCVLCIGFWLCWIPVLIAYLFIREPELLIIPFCAFGFINHYADRNY